MSLKTKIATIKSDYNLYNNWLEVLIIRIFPHKIVCNLRKGYYLEVLDKYDLSVIEEIFGKQIYQKAFKTKQKTVLSIGAHIGVFCAYATWQGADRIYAYEPETRNFFMLINNCHRNNLPVIAYDKAISNYSKNYEKLYIDYSPSHTLIKEEKRKNNVGYEMIEIIDIREVIDKFEHIDLMKIDCEGSEYNILMGCNLEEFHKIDSIIFEYHKTVYPKLFKIFRHLAKFGYEFDGDEKNTEEQGIIYCYKR